jgi:hypothetical protein
LCGPQGACARCGMVAQGSDKPALTWAYDTASR